MNGNANNELLIQFMKQYLANDPMSLPQPLSEEQVKALYALAAKHDVAHLVGVVAEKLPREQQEAFRPFVREQMKAMFRYEKIHRETQRICEVLETCAIPYIPMKGAVIRGLYHEPWHRTSCDIDVLVPADRLEEAVAALETQLGYENRGVSFHDVSLWSPKGVHLELHFDIDEVHVTREQIWQNASPEEGRYCHNLSGEMLIVTYTAHMAKHFLNGGCGLRPFLDLWFMEKKLTFDASRVEQMLADAGLETFIARTNTLMKVWFLGGEMDAFTEQMQEYILPGGVYGNTKNRIAVSRTQGITAVRYLMGRLFPPLKALKQQYPVLSRHPWLLPWCWLCRAARHLVNGKARELGAEYKINREFTKDDRDHTDQLLCGLGLKG